MRPIDRDGVACLLVTFMSPGKMAEWIEMPFGWATRLTRVGPGNHALDRVQIPQGKGAISGMFGPLDSIASYCCGVRSKNQ